MHQIYFGGAGWLFPFYFGVAHVLQDTLYLDDVASGGVSAGSVTALFMLLGVDMQKACEFAYNQPNCVKCNPFFMKHILHDVLDAFVPTKAHFLDLCDRLFVMVTKHEGMTLKPQIIKSYTSRKECIDTIKASCHLPVIHGLRGFKMHGCRYYDGGLMWKTMKNSVRQNPMIVVSLDPEKDVPYVIHPGITFPYVGVLFPQSMETMQHLFDLGCLRAHEFIAKHQELFKGICKHDILMFGEQEKRKLEYIIYQLEVTKTEWYQKIFYYVLFACVYLACVTNTL